MLVLRGLDRTAQGWHTIHLCHAAVCSFFVCFIVCFFPLQHLPFIQSIFYFLIIGLNYFGYLMYCNL